MPMHWGIGYDWAVFVALFAWLILMGITTWIIVYAWLWRRAERAALRAHFMPNERESLETLRRRYVHGDIGTDTFEQAREQLEVPARAEDTLVSAGR